MKTRRFIVLSSILAAALALPLGQPAKASEFLLAQSQNNMTQADLTVEVTGLKDMTGRVLIGLYNSADGFNMDREIDGQVAPVNASTARVSFENLPVGRYAVKVFHDLDSDGKFDKDFMGIPSEPYGFSNNASDPFSAPEWSEARFALPRGRMTQTINLD